ncbi:MAG: geopeptide radical SAM maturase [Geobacteraceae bacterium]|nr:geopeptide radical SAM maturase [Geobacteraceae bacterium]
MQITRYLKTYPRPDKPGRVILLATRRCAVLELSTGLWERLSSGGEPTPQEQETLCRLGVLVADRDVEREELRTTFDTLNRSSRRLEVTAVLTLACNLACPYCFEEPFRGPVSMSPETAGLLVQRLSEQMAQGLDILVDFYGGEALLRLDLLRSIATQLKAAAKRHGVGFSFNIFSNGVLLTRATVAELLPLGLKTIRTTLDGPPEIHNAQRPFVSGRGSFDTIMHNLVAVHDLVGLSIGGNYTRDNYRRFPEMLDLLLAAGIDPARLHNVAFAPVMPKADGSGMGDHAATCACSAEAWAIEANLFLRDETLRRGFPTDRLGPSACMIEFEQDWVVGHDGAIYKCPVFMGDKRMQVGSLSEGLSDYRQSHNLDLWKNEECLECAYLPLCFGGCRFFRRLKSGAIDGVDCRRIMLDAALERIVRQDLGLGP